MLFDESVGVVDYPIVGGVRAGDGELELIGERLKLFRLDLADGDRWEL